MTHHDTIRSWKDQADSATTGSPVDEPRFYGEEYGGLIAPGTELLNTFGCCSASATNGCD